MKNDLLAYRHIGISEKDEEKMLQKIGVKSLDELIDKTIPANIRLKEPLALPKTMTEYEFGQHIAGLAAKNKLYTTYIGMGWYNTITPAVIQRNVFENPVWYTSYTPYQTEVSQGRLEALMNFQTAVCDLTGMPLANCSLLDEATAAAEAVTMMYALRPRDMQKSGANVVFVDEAVFPQTLAVMTTRAIPQGIELRIGKYHEMEFTPDIFACVLQYPNAAGNVEDYRAFVEKAHAANCKVAVAADILSLALLTPPGEWGADIVFGTTQRLGTPMFYGGPSAAYFATRDEYKLTGWSVEPTGSAAYDFSTQVTADVTLYAQWARTAHQWTITFDLNGGAAPAGKNAGELYAAQKVYDGDSLISPTQDQTNVPVLEGYEFQGWSTVRNDALAKSVLSFDENGKSLMPIDRDGTVYALWAKMGTVVKPPTSTSDSTTQSQIGAYSNTETGLNGLAMFEAVVRQPGKFPNTDFGSITEESTPWVN